MQAHVGDPFLCVSVPVSEFVISLNSLSESTLVSYCSASSSPSSSSSSSAASCVCVCVCLLFQMYVSVYQTIYVVFIVLVNVLCAQATVKVNK